MVEEFRAFGSTHDDREEDYGIRNNYVYYCCRHWFQVRANIVDAGYCKVLFSQQVRIGGHDWRISVTA